MFVYFFCQFVDIIISINYEWYEKYQVETIFILFVDEQYRVKENVVSPLYVFYIFEFNVYIFTPIEYNSIIKKFDLEFQDQG